MRLPNLSTLGDGLRASIVRFPIPSAFSLTVTLLLMVLIELDFDDGDPLFRYAFLGALGFVLSLLVDLVTEAIGTSTRTARLSQIGTLGFLIAFQFLLMPETLEDSKPPFWYSYFILIFGIHLAIALVPALSGPGGQGIWRFNLSCFLRFFFSSINAALLFGGLALAILSVDKLFEVGIHEEIYGQLWVACAFLAHPLICLAGIPKPGDPETRGEFPKPLRFTLCFVGLPVIAIYLIILYAYLAKIGIQWEWPDGWVAMPIFILSVISLLTFVLSLPLPAKEVWAERFHRWLFRLLFPLSIVLFLALQVRLGEYGMTINRYLGLALAVWLFGLSLAHLIRPKLPVAWMPFSLLLVALFSIYSGPLGAFGWSERAQTERIRSLGADLGVYEDGVLVPSTDSQESESLEEFNSALRYVLDNFGPEALEKDLEAFFAQTEGEDLHSKRGYYLTNQIMGYLELNDDLSRNISLYYNADALEIKGYDWKIDHSLYNYRGNRDQMRQYEVGEHELEISQSNEAHQIEIRVNGTTVSSIDLDPWAETAIQVFRSQGSNLMEPLRFNEEAAGWSFLFILQNAQLDSKISRFESARFVILLTAPE